MIETLHVKEHLSFQEANVNFRNGLIVFTGSSGAGKSVFFNALLSVFGLSSCEASLIEATVSNQLNLEEYGFENEDENIFKCVKQKSMRYFINSSQFSQKNIKQISQNFISYLSARENSEFDNLSLIELIDLFIAKNDSLHARKVEEYKEYFATFSKISKELEKINKEEKKIFELKEFTIFEIEKIERISPKLGEDEELMEFKKRLSKKEKIINAIEQASVIFDIEDKVNLALDLIDKKSDVFDEAMNFLRATFENEKDKFEELEDIDIEKILDRIEEIGLLKNRFGSIKEALCHLENKKEELKYYENISFEKKNLEKKFNEIKSILDLHAKDIGQKRKNTLISLQNVINSYLKELFLENIVLHARNCDIYSEGIFEFDVTLNNTDIKKISSGELNRLRLAFIATKNELKSLQNSVLILDEIDSNLSGKESMSIANVLKKISKNYQIFAISHHPQLSSCADQHFSIFKKNDESFIKELNEEERIEELSRMISGKTINEKARDFARELRKTNR